MPTTVTGLENLIDAPPRWLKDCRLGLVANPASVGPNLVHARELIEDALPGRLAALYSPQHGFFAEKQDNMIESDDMVDPLTGLPVFSLYGATRIPTGKMLDPVDVIIFDLQDVGTRVYTFMYTLSYCLEAAKSFGKKVVVLDRPNPIGGVLTEGNLLNDEYASFVGRYPIPMRHGLTMGELARLFNTVFGIGADLTVIPLTHWKRTMHFEDTGLPWVAPSPNLPTPSSAMVYPGQVLWEGTNISEGRGTTQPFELFGAPFLTLEKILADFKAANLSGVRLRPAPFEPTSGKWANTTCAGFQMHVTDRELFRPYRTSLELLSSIIRHHRDRFTWKTPPYEYEMVKLPIDLILGAGALRESIEKGEPLERLEKAWEPGLINYRQISEASRLYQ